MKFNIKRSLLIFGLILPLSQGVFAAESSSDEEQDIEVSNDSNEAEEASRWFQVELIVFKPNNEKSMLDESWDKNLKFTQANNLIDFLQPFYLETSSNEPTNEIMTTTDIKQQSFENKKTIKQSKNQNNSSIVDINSIDEEAKLLTKFNQPVQEKPFVLLSNDLLQLSQEAKNLSRHSEYKVLTHLAWRQPMLGKNESANIRIAGGQDLSNRFTYDGNQLNNNLSTENVSDDELNNEMYGLPLDESNSVFQQSQSFNRTTNLDHSNATVIVKQSNLIPKIIPMLWVPELDGDIKIYLNRYLHIQTNLFLRKPGKEIIEAVDLDLFNPELFNNLSTEKGEKGEIDPTPINASISSQNILSSKGNTKNQNSTQMNNELLLNKKPQHFSWEISDSFLEEASEKIFVERLFNYSVNQSRRVRSGELHYFDHPLLGLVILITPYELPTEPVGNLNDKKKLN